jgi:DHA1 family tetracycline resistance protein-like MFS transporter
MAESSTSESPPPTVTAPKSALLFIVLTIFIDMLGIGILIPVIPFMVRRFSPDAITIGLLSGAFAVCQFAAAPVLGRLSDRHGRRPLLLISLLGTGIGYVFFGAAQSLGMMFFARILDGITGGNISIAQAYIADVTKPEDRSKNFGLVGAAFGLGFIIGPGLGGALYHYGGLSAPAYAAAALAFANTMFGYFRLPESLPAGKRAGARFTIRGANPFPGLAAAIRRQPLGTLLIATFTFNFAFVGLQSNFVFFSLERFGWGPSQNAMLFSVIGVLGAFMQGYLVRRLAGPWSDRGLAVTGLAVQSLSLILIAWAPSAWMLFPICGVMSLASGMATPTLTALISSSVPAAEQGATMGVTQSVNSLTRIFGPLWAGLMYDHVGPSAPYWGGAIITMGAVALVWSIHRPQLQPASGST